MGRVLDWPPPSSGLSCPCTSLRCVARQRNHAGQLFDTAKLKQLQRSRMFAKDLDDRLTAHGPLSGPPPQQWEQFKTLVTESAKLTIVPNKKVHQDWFNENDERIKKLDDKKKAFIEWQNDISSTSKRNRFKHLQRQAQTALRRMQDEWLEKKADEIETYATTKNSKMFSSAIKEVYGPTKPRTTPLLSTDGSTLLKEMSSINERWREHFSTLLNRPSTVNPTVLDQIPQKPVITSLDLPSTIYEVSKAIKQTSSGKSPGMDGISAEIVKSTGLVALEALHSLLTSIWEVEDVPKEFRKATFVSLFKNRGSKTDCGNYRGISLLSITRKILSRVILIHLITNTSEENLPRQASQEIQRLCKGQHKPCRNYSQGASALRS